MRSQSVAVLGAGGFVGRHIVRELASHGHAVQAWSLEAPPHDAGEHVQWRQIDLDRIEKSDLEADVAIHVAEASVLGDLAQHQRNVERAGRVLASRVGRVLYASSAAVYGDGNAEPCGEDAPTPGGSPYSAAKLAVEALLRADERSTVVRMANVYGPGMSHANVLSDILGQLGGDGPISVRDLGPVRDYLHVEDAARGFADLVAHRLGGVVNLGSGVGTSVEQLARAVCRAAGTPERDLVATAPSHGRSVLVLDIARARRELGWQPTISIEQGITRLVQEQTS